MDNQPKNDYWNKIPVFVVIAVVFLVFTPSLFNGFVNWDDDVHLLQNPFVQTLDIEHVIDIFTTTVNRIYIPLTSLTFAVEYHFFGSEPFIYHFNNLLLHMAVTVLVWVFARYCGLSQWAAAIAALIFGVHPMHVESVAWVTERKDVLYGFFYMLALVLYCRYIRVTNADGESKEAKKIFVLVILCAVLSALAKPMALSFPLILVLCDWYFKRRLSLKIWIEKVYIAAFMAPIIWVTYFLNSHVMAAKAAKSVLIWFWCFVFYLKKFLFPDYFVLLYKVPENISLYNVAYLSVVAIFVLITIAAIFFRKNRVFIFSLLFYFFSIFFILRFDRVQDGFVVSDRYMYLPSVGICLLIGCTIHYVFTKYKKQRPLIVILCTCMICYLSILTANQIKVWKNGVALWEHQFRRDPQVESALLYNKLGDAYLESDNFDYRDHDYFEKIERLYQKTLAMRPDFYHVYGSLGNLFLKIENYEKAEQFYKRALSLRPKYVPVHYDLGRMYFKMGQFQKGEESFCLALQLSSRNEIIGKNISQFYFKNTKHKETFQSFKNRCNY